MTEDQKNKLAELAGKAHDAERYYQALGMMNTAVKTPEELRQQAIDYAIAQASAIETRAKLEAAIRFIGENANAIIVASLDSHQQPKS